MKAISSRLQIELIVFGYVSVAAYAMVSWYVRHLAELGNPIDAQGGMWAAGDEMLSYFIFFLFLVPTFFLLRLMGNSDKAYDRYSKLAIAAAVTAPISLLLLIADAAKVSSVIGDIALIRLFRSPMFWTVLVISRIFARSKVSKRLINWAVTAETVTILSGLGMLILAARRHS